MKTFFTLLTGILLGAIPLVTFFVTLFFMADNKPISKRPYIALAIIWLIDLIIFAVLIGIHIPSLALLLSMATLVFGFIGSIYSVLSIFTLKPHENYSLKPLMVSLSLFLAGIILISSTIAYFGPFTFKLF